ncbi:hypothetical protein M1N92_05785 [Dehalococcoidia bacterium]|nr:hypothetical protein [Dehalococcoidia bacterium]
MHREPIAFAILQNRSDAEDTVQEAFITSPLRSISRIAKIVAMNWRASESWTFV